MWANFQRIIITFYQKNFYYLCSQKYGFGIRDTVSGIQDPEKTYPGSRGLKRHRIPDPDPQHCLLENVIVSEKFVFR